METQDIISNSSQSVFQKMGKYTYLILFIVLVLLVLIIYYYNSYIGKYVKKDLSGFRKLLNSGETEVDNVEISMGYSPPQSLNDKPGSLIPDKKLDDKFDKLIKGKEDSEETDKKQVFNISDNVYSYYDAMALCKAYDSELATAKQLKDAYDNKADWCNYGWTEGQLALYPTQKETWDKLQQGPKKHRNDCGKPGLNGGYFENPYLKFGVNCYGKKPKPTQKEKEIIKLSTNPYLTQKEKEFNEKVDYYKSQRYDTTILPFSKNNWSRV
jgi:hypothetical protein